MSFDDDDDPDDPDDWGGRVVVVVVVGRRAPSGRQIVWPTRSGDEIVFPLMVASGPAFTPARSAMPYHESPG
jgi:hypothetical protein